ncbi:hypothetical protein TNCV_430011 [Trichonephila clavipes]|nr:hypothetical protein TNCV_430011 [Trichonephila clavipes]
MSPTIPTKDCQRGPPSQQKTANDIKGKHFKRYSSLLEIISSNNGWNTTFSMYRSESPLIEKRIFSLGMGFLFVPVTKASKEQISGPEVQEFKLSYPKTTAKTIMGDPPIART